jgi:hypothetical protein
MSVVAWLEGLPKAEALSAAQQGEAHGRIKDALTDTRSVRGVLVVLGILTLVGAIYVGYKVW